MRVPDHYASGNLTDTVGAVSLPLAGYSGAGFVLSGTWSATVIAEVSCDGGVTWNHTCLWQVAGTSGPTGNSSTSASGNGQYMAQELGGATHIRVRAAAFTSGTVVVALSTTFGIYTSLPNMQGVGNTNWFGSHRLAVIGGADQGSAAREIHLSNAGPLPTDYGVIVRQAPYSFGNITTNTTITLKSGAGMLHTLTVNAPGSAETLTFFDNTAGSGTKIATVTPVAGMCLTWDAKFATGLTVVSAGTTPGDYTVTYA